MTFAREEQSHVAPERPNWAVADARIVGCCILPGRKGLLRSVGVVKQAESYEREPVVGFTVAHRAELLHSYGVRASTYLLNGRA